MAGYGYGISVSGSRTPVVASSTPAPPPSGIVVATTNTINVVDTFGYNGTIALSKISSTSYSASVGFIYGTAFCEAISGDVDVNIAAIRLIKESGYWFYRYEGFYDCDGNIFGVSNDITSVIEVTSGIIPTTGWDPSLTLTAAPSGIPTATTNTITLQSGASGFPIFLEDNTPFPKQDIGYFGDAGDYKLVWSGSRWELLGDNSFVNAYNTTSGQTTNYFPDQGNWFDYLNQPASLIFVGS